jgi:hypothetical protein
MSKIRSFVLSILAAGVVVAMTALTSFAASEFEGVWAVKDTNGTPFEITLSPDGKATTTQEQAGPGTWKEEGGAAVISWASGWTTKIAKDGDHYVKSAFKKGASLDGPPTNTSDAMKK